MLAQVSTLLSTVGWPQRPSSAVWMYLGRGSPASPRCEVSSAEDSPQTNAPPPRTISRSKLKPLPRMSSPSRP